MKKERINKFKINYLLNNKNRRFKGVLSPKGFPQTRKSDSVRLCRVCVRACEAVCARKRDNLLNARASNEKFSASSSSSFPSLMALGFLHGFFRFELILAVICMGFVQRRLRGIVFRMDFIEL